MKFARIFLCLIMCLPALVKAQNLQVLGDSVVYYSERGKWADAARLGDKLLENFVKEHGRENDAYVSWLGYLTTAYENSGAPGKAEGLYLEAEQITRKLYGQNSKQYAVIMESLGVFYTSQRSFDKAEPTLRQAGFVYEQVAGKKSREYATLLYNLAVMYINKETYEQAEPQVTEYISLLKQLVPAQSTDMADGLALQAELYERMKQYDKAEPLFIEVLDIQQKTLGNNNPNYNHSLYRLADVYIGQSRYADAEPLYLRALEFRIRHYGAESEETAECLHELGRLYKHTGAYAKAEPLLLQAVAIRKILVGENHPDYAEVVDNLAGVYEQLGSYDKAESRYIQALNIRKQVFGVYHFDYAMSLNNLALLYWNKKQPQRAVPLLEEALAIHQKNKNQDESFYGTGLNNLAVLYEAVGRVDKVEALYLEALEIRKKAVGQDHPSYANNINNLGMFYQKQKQYKKAEDLFKQALSIWAKVMGTSHPDYGIALGNLADLYEQTGRYNEAAQLYTRVLEIVKRNMTNNFASLSEAEKAKYIARAVHSNDNYNNLLFKYPAIATDFYRQGYNLQMFLKSLLLSDTRNTLDALKSSSDTALHRIFSSWQRAKSALARQYSLPLISRSKELPAMEQEAERLEKELNRRSSGFRSGQQQLGLTAAHVARNLKPGEAAIEFVSFRIYRNSRWADSTMYAAYILHSMDSVPVFVPLFEEKQLQALINRSGGSATDVAKSLYRGTGGKNTAYMTRDLGKELYQLVWQPMEKHLANVKAISYTPAGKLYGIAFNAIPVNDTVLLADRYSLQQYISTRYIVTNGPGQNINIPENAVVFGNPDFDSTPRQGGNAKSIRSPYQVNTRSVSGTLWEALPGTAAEISKIRELFVKNSTPAIEYAGIEASEENLKALSGKSPDVLHLATHGFFLPKAEEKQVPNETGYNIAEDPLLRSGLVLAGGNQAWSGKPPQEGEDGILTAYEISQMDLSATDLVVLSACETALGDIQGSEGVFGLQRSFKMAGVKNMIVSLWQVPDAETAELMNLFYSKWIGGASLRDALAGAQAVMRKKYDPYYWAAFVLVQ